MNEQLAKAIATIKGKTNFQRTAELKNKLDVVPAKQLASGDFFSAEQVAALLLVAFELGEEHIAFEEGYLE